MNFALLNPTKGIESIGRYETGRLTMPSGSDAQIVGGQVRQSAPALYKGHAVDDTVRSLLAPRLKDPSLLLPNVFDAACADTFDKMKDSLGRKDKPTDAHIFMEGNSGNRDQLRENVNALKSAH